VTSDGAATAGSIAVFVSPCRIEKSGIFESDGNVYVGANLYARDRVTAKSFMGDGTNLANVNAAKLDGMPPSAFQPAGSYAGLGANTFSATQTISSGDLALEGGGITQYGIPFIWSPGSGLQDTFLGLNAGNSRLVGTQDTAVGVNALASLTNGDQDTAVGANALSAGAYGGSNTAVGYFALSPNSGSSNTAVGRGALGSNTTASNNTAVGDSALLSNTTGNGNTATGTTALQSNTTGNDNTALGYFADVTSGNLTNATVIGAFANVSSSNALVLGSTAAQNGSANTNVGIDVGSPSNIFTVLQGGGHAISDGWDTYSSRRWKSNIHTIHGALGKVQQLRGVEYTQVANGQRDIGMVAEEVGKVVPEVVSYEANGKDARGIDYSRLTALLVEATKEQQDLIRKQQAQIKALQARLDALQAQIARLASRVPMIHASLTSRRGSGSALHTVRSHVGADTSPRSQTAGLAARSR
jgi:hypothetical protein